MFTAEVETTYLVVLNNGGVSTTVSVELSKGFIYLRYICDSI